MQPGIAFIVARAIWQLLLGLAGANCGGMNLAILDILEHACFPA
jgi:hypothetical protein